MGCVDGSLLLSNRGHMKEYKVITQNDEWFSGRFDGKLLEALINKYARSGWTVKSMVSSSREGVFLGGSKDELLILLERRLPSSRSKTPPRAEKDGREAFDTEDPAPLDPEAEEADARERERKLERLLAEIDANVSDPTERQRQKLRAIGKLS